MICGQQWFTLTTIQENGIDDRVRSQAVKIFVWLYGFVQSIFTIRFDNNSHHFAASGSMHTGFYGNYGSAYA